MRRHDQGDRSEHVVKHKGKKTIRKKQTVVLASGSYSLAAGKSGAVTLRMSAAGKKKLAKSHRASPKLVILVTGGKAVEHKVSWSLPSRVAGDRRLPAAAGGRRCAGVQAARVRAPARSSSAGEQRREHSLGRFELRPVRDVCHRQQRRVRQPLGDPLGHVRAGDRVEHAPDERARHVVCSAARRPSALRRLRGR